MESEFAKCKLDKDSKIFKHEPYFTYEHINKKMGLIQNWCKLLMIKLKKLHNQMFVLLDLLQ